MNGGYVIIDCSGLNLGSLGKVDGIYAKVKAAIDAEKPLYLGNVVNGTTKFSPIPAFGGVEEGGVFVSFEPVTIHITTGDVVSV